MHLTPLSMPHTDRNTTCSSQVAQKIQLTGEQAGNVLWDLQDFPFLKSSIYSLKFH